MVSVSLNGVAKVVDFEAEPLSWSHSFFFVAWPRRGGGAPDANEAIGFGKSGITLFATRDDAAEAMMSHPDYLSLKIYEVETTVKRNQ